MSPNSKPNWALKFGPIAGSNRSAKPSKASSYASPAAEQTNYRPAWPQCPGDHVRTLSREAPYTSFSRACIKPPPCTVHHPSLQQATSPSTCTSSLPFRPTTSRPAPYACTHVPCSQLYINESHPRAPCTSARCRLDHYPIPKLTTSHLLFPMVEPHHPFALHHATTHARPLQPRLNLHDPYQLLQPHCSSPASQTDSSSHSLSHTSPSSSYRALLPCRPAFPACCAPCTSTSAVRSLPSNP